MDIFSHSTQICGEYAFDLPQGQARAAGNQGLAQRDFASMDFSKRRMHGQISSIKTAIFTNLPWVVPSRIIWEMAQQAKIVTLLFMIGWIYREIHISGNSVINLKRQEKGREEA